MPNHWFDSQPPNFFNRLNKPSSRRQHKKSTGLAKIDSDLIKTERWRAFRNWILSWNQKYFLSQLSPAIWDSMLAINESIIGKKIKENQKNLKVSNFETKADLQPHSTIFQSCVPWTVPALLYCLCRYVWIKLCGASLSISSIISFLHSQRRSYQRSYWRKNSTYLRQVYR